jgi:hypothetical protein
VLCANGTRLTKALIASATLVLALVVCYFSYFYIAPSITVVNDSGRELSSFVVKLPSSTLNFGEMAALQKNTIYYSISQEDGHYSLTAIFADGETVSATCGCVEQNEVNKRVIITFGKEGRFTCART